MAMSPSPWRPIELLLGSDCGLRFAQRVPQPIKHSGIAVWPQYQREGLRSASDMKDAEWSLIAPLLPPPSRLGRPRETNLREVVNAILYMPHRWVVERTFAWLGRCRRLVKDFEATIASAVAWILVAHIRTLLRRLARL
jgi:transposase